jgi:predicted Zn-dependent protease
MSGAAAISSVRAYDETDERRQLSARCESLAEHALAGGAHEAEAFGTRSRTISVRFEKGDLKSTQVDEGSTLGLRVFRDRRLGFASTNQADDRALARAATDALTLSGFAPPDAFNRLPDAVAIAPTPSLVEPELAELGVEAAVEIARDFVARVQRIDRRISIDGATCQVQRG